MASCEKCWFDATDAAMLSGNPIIDEYILLLEKRKDNPCTPEQQAGPGATKCLKCGRRTVHQHMKECVVCGGKGGHE